MNDISLLRFFNEEEKKIFHEFQVRREQEIRQKMERLLIAILAWDWNNQKSENWMFNYKMQAKAVFT